MARKVLRLSGGDARSFLQNLVTNDVGGIDRGLVWAALLTPQGKYLADFFLVADGADILLDVDAGLAPGLAQRLGMYRLRADVRIEETEIVPATGLGDAPEGALPDPRHPALGWRAYDGRAGEADLTALRIEHVVPETGVELIPNETYPLEAGFERLHGVDFRKGCYVGQEVTARMKHKTELRKGLAQVEVAGEVAPGTEILAADGRAAGTLFTTQNGRGIAFLRFDRASGEMTAGDARVTFVPATRP